MANLFESEPMTIGKHDWRVIVYQHPSYGPCTEYQFRRSALCGLPVNRWNPDTEFHGYNHNDGMYAGLPKTLVKLYKKNLPNIEPLLRVRISNPSPEQ